MPDSKPRVPPGQVVTHKWPVLHYGDVPRVDLSTWTFRVWGLVKQSCTWTWDQFQALPRERIRVDIHCVTRWSRLDTEFEGVPPRILLEQAGVLPEAQYVLVHAEAGFTTNLPLEDLLRENVLLADHADGQPLTPEHGWPLRLVVPHLYFWKSAKWVRGFELLREDRPGFWERNGYHRRGDPWTEQRFWDD